MTMDPNYQPSDADDDFENAPDDLCTMLPLSQQPDPGPVPLGGPGSVTSCCCWWVGVLQFLTMHITQTCVGNPPSGVW